MTGVDPLPAALASVPIDESALWAPVVELLRDGPEWWAHEFEFDRLMLMCAPFDEFGWSTVTVVHKPTGAAVLEGRVHWRALLPGRTDP